MDEDRSRDVFSGRDLDEFGDAGNQSPALLLAIAFAVVAMVTLLVFGMLWALRFRDDAAPVPPAATASTPEPEPEPETQPIPEPEAALQQGPEYLGKTFKLSEKFPQGRAMGWIYWNSGYRLSIGLMRQKGSSYPAGDYFEVWVPSAEDKTAKTFSEAESAIIKQYLPLDLVDVEWFERDGYQQGIRRLGTSIKMLRRFPPKGTLAGRVRWPGRRSFHIKISVAPEGYEDMLGHTICVRPGLLPPADDAQDSRPVPDPELQEIFEGLKDGDMVEINYVITPEGLRAEKVMKPENPDDLPQPPAKPALETDRKPLKPPPADAPAEVF